MFNERLAVTGGINSEASTNDGGVNRYYSYPKASVSYRFPNPFSGVDEIKLRGAYGVSGTVPNYGVKFDADSLRGYSGSLGIKEGLVAGDPGHYAGDEHRFRGRIRRHAVQGQADVQRHGLPEAHHRTSCCRPRRSPRWATTSNGSTAVRSRTRVSSCRSQRRRSRSASSPGSRGKTSPATRRS